MLIRFFLFKLFRVSALLQNDGVSPRSQRRAISSIVAHEFAHQFFGNLVTPTWWTYLWLNEGFATLFAAYATQQAYPEFNEMDYFVTSTVQPVLNSDSSDTTRIMSQEAYCPRCISGLFDNIAYDKSGSVLRMFMYAFSEATFLKGLKEYLNDK